MTNQYNLQRNKFDVFLYNRAICEPTASKLVKAKSNLSPAAIYPTKDNDAEKWAGCPDAAVSVSLITSTSASEIPLVVLFNTKAI